MSSHEQIYADWVSRYLTSNIRADELRRKCKQSGFGSLDSFLDRLRDYEPFVTDFTNFRWKHEDQSFVDVPITGDLRWWTSNAKLKAAVEALNHSAAPSASHTVIQSSVAGHAAKQTPETAENLAVLKVTITNLLRHAAGQMLPAYAESKAIPLPKAQASVDKLLQLFWDAERDGDRAKQQDIVTALAKLANNLEPFAGHNPVQSYALQEAKERLEQYSDLLSV